MNRQLRQGTTIIQTLELRATGPSSETEYVFLRDGGGQRDVITFSQLYQEARVIAGALQDLGAGGQRALLLHPAGLGFLSAFFGCLLAGVVAVPAPAPRANRGAERVVSLLQDAEASLVLVPAAMEAQVREQIARSGLSADLRWLCTDVLDAGLAEVWQERAPEPDALAYLQYTSGSTSTPRGVMISHRNLMHNLQALGQFCVGDERPHGVSWLPHTHDMGLNSLLWGIYNDCPLTTMAPASFVQRPLRWLEAIHHAKPGHVYSPAPNFAYDLCARVVTEEQRRSLDLSNWRAAFNGAEPVRLETLRRFCEAFGPCGFQPEAFIPTYGLAEARLFVTGMRDSRIPASLKVRTEALARHEIALASDDEPQTTIVSCGKVADGLRVLIVDPDTRKARAADQVGEIWVQGPSVAAGYWRRSEETAATFGGVVADSGEGPFLRTGDLGFLHGGELHVTGRLKDLLILYGRNHYPQDIERAVERAHALVRPGASAAFSVPMDGGERPVVVAEVSRHFREDQTQEVVNSIRRAISEQCELELYAVCLVRALTQPMTTSGKVQRGLARSAFLGGQLHVVGSWTRPVATEEGDDPPAAPAPARVSATELSEWLTGWIAREMHVPRAELDLRAPFSSYGLDSLAAIRLVGELEVVVGRSLSPTLVYEHPNIGALAAHLGAEQVPLEVAPGARASFDAPIPGEMQVAIIGIGCRFPGADGPEQFWSLLAEGRDAIEEVPRDRWDVASFYDPRPFTPGRMNTRWGGFLKGIDQFDPPFFGISPREAASMDPQQRLLMEVSWEALEDAGLTRSRIARAPVGVFLGISGSEYGALQLTRPDLIDAYWSTGSALSVAANRLSYFYDLRGPSVAVDTACSSSLVAVHLAVQSLRQGECSLAIAGGVNLILTPTITVNFSMGGGTSPDGRCKAFDRSANGMVRSEGVGLVILKPLERALADGDPIYAIIRGSAVNQDGASNGIAAPNREAQEDVLRAACRSARVEPGDLQYIEAHGTGTPLGDPIEARAIGHVVGAAQPPGEVCRIGSVKSNLGHLEAAAGVASLIKVALSMKHRQLPRSLHFREPSPYIDFAGLRVAVQQSHSVWPSRGGLCLAGVSAFGFGGTNAHLVLEGPPPAPERSVAAGAPGASSSADARILLLSGHRPEALGARARDLLAMLDGPSPDLSLSDLCYTTNLRRTHLDSRGAIVFSTREELLRGLRALGAGTQDPTLTTGRFRGGKPGVALVFSGHGSQWWAMGRGLLQSDASFRDTMVELDGLVCAMGGASLLEAMIAPEAEAPIGAGGLGGAGPQRVTSFSTSQVALFALQVALARLWTGLGLQPSFVVGHSMGEVAAACVSGALSLRDGVRVILHRSRLLEEFAGTATSAGAMALVRMSREDASRSLSGREALISVASHNAPNVTVLSGDAEALRALVRELKGRGVAAVMSNVPGAGHCPQIEPVRARLVELLEGGDGLEPLRPTAGSVPLVSTVLGEVTSGVSLDPSYWGRNLRETVLFSEAMDRLLAAEVGCFLELSPDPLLVSPMTQCLRGREPRGVVIPSLRQKVADRVGLLEAVGQLHVLGVALDLRPLHPGRSRCVPLPRFPWQQERCWIAGMEDMISGERTAVSRASPAVGARDAHPLLGALCPSEGDDTAQCWEARIDLQRMPYLTDHQIRGFVMAPGAMFVEMALAGAREVLGGRPLRLMNLRFQRAMYLERQRPARLRLIVERADPDTLQFRCASAGLDANGADTWTTHVTGEVQLAEGAPPEQPRLDEIQRLCTAERSGAESYETARLAGAQFGDSFQTVERFWVGEGQAIGRIRASAKVQGELGDYLLHPTLWDALFQMLAGTRLAAMTDVSEEAIHVPQSLDALQLFRRPAPEDALWGYFRLREESQGAGFISGDLILFAGDGEPLAKVEGFRAQRMEAAEATSLQDWFYHLGWWPTSLSAGQDAPSGERARFGGTLLLADRSGVAERLARLLEEEGGRVWLVSAGDRLRQLDERRWEVDPAQSEQLRHVLDEVRGASALQDVLHLWSLDAPGDERCTAAELSEAQVRSALSAAHLVQSLITGGGVAVPRLWLVTGGAQAVTGGDGALSLAQAPVWGIGRALAFEHPELRTCMVDLPRSPTEADLRALADELSGGEVENQVAFRDGARLCARLERGSAPPSRPRPEEFTVRSDGTYLITGGLGGLGLTVAGWLVDRGARRLVLMSRRPPAEDARERVRQLVARGAEVVVESGDVVDERAVVSVLDRIRARGAPLRGVVHTAAHLDDCPVLRLDWPRLRSVMAPKLEGSWYLHQHTLQDPLDLFVLFSSVVSLFGSPFQANYAAANVFVDALAAHRVALGLPGLSVNWGRWSQVGGAARGLGGRLPQGFRSISPERGVEALEMLLQGTGAQSVVLPVHWQRVRQAYPGAVRWPVLARIWRQDESSIRGPVQAPASGERARTDDGFVAPRTPLEMKLAELWSEVLGHKRVSVHDNFVKMGGDSLMAVQVISKLSALTSREITTQFLLEHPTIAELAAAMEAPEAPRPVSSEPARQTTEHGTTVENRPLLALTAVGALPPVQSAALCYLGRLILDNTGLSSEELIQEFCQELPHYVARLETPLGPIAMVMLPVTEPQLYRDQEALVRMIMEGLAMARQVGAQNVSMMGLLPSASDYGRAVARAMAGRGDLPRITTGHATTASSVVTNGIGLLEKAGRDISGEDLAFLGLGSVGMASLRLMLRVLPQPRSLLLSDVYAKRPQLEAVREEVMHHWGDGSRVRIADSGDRAPEALYEASFIVGATNVPGIVDIDRLRPGTLIVDDSVPHCFVTSAAIRRLQDRGDILFTEAGMLRAPGKVGHTIYMPRRAQPRFLAEMQKGFLSSINPQGVPCCILASLLSFSSPELSPTIGVVDPENAVKHFRALARLGFGAADLHCEDYVLPESAIETFKARFGGGTR